MCRAMQVSEDAFYAWASGKIYRLSPQKTKLAAAVKEVFYLHRRRARGKKNQFRTRCRRIFSRAPACRLIDEGARFEGDLSESFQSAHNRFAPRFRVFTESAA
jgi:hypothetical protein